MDWKFNADKPIYAQLVDHVERAIITGEYPPGSRMPGVRELAAEAGVNPNTMQRALAELEIRGMLFAQRTNGRFVTEDKEHIQKLRSHLAKETTIRYIKNMLSIGCGVDEIIQFVNDEEKNITKS